MPLFTEQTTVWAAEYVLVAVAYFFLAGLYVHAVRRDMDPMWASLSNYLKGPSNQYLRIAYFLLSLAMIAFGLILCPSASETSGSMTAGGLFVLAGLGLMLVVPTANFYGEPGSFENRVRILHRSVVSVTFISITTAMLIESWLLRASGKVLPLFLLVLAVVCLIVFLMNIFNRSLPKGMEQKALIGAILVWLGLAAAGFRFHLFQV